MIKQAQAMPPEEAYAPAPAAPEAIAQEAPAADQQQNIPPLNSAGAILNDFDIKTAFFDEGNNNASEMTNQIWYLYGGSQFGGITSGRTGEGSLDRGGDRKESAERWRRLDPGKTIADIISYEDLYKLVIGAIAAISRTNTQPPGAQQTPIASHIMRVVVANEYIGNYHISDSLLKMFRFR